jgi:hypothetical protein
MTANQTDPATGTRSTRPKAPAEACAHRQPFPAAPDPARWDGRARSPCDRHRARAGDGRCAEGRQRPSRHRDERGSHGLDFVRPADANETAVAWRTILEHNDRPAGLSLSRQNLAVFDRTEFASAEGAARGGYVAG